MKLWNWIKGLWNGGWDFLLKYQSHVCLSLGLIAVFMVFTLWSNFNWTMDVLKVEKDKTLLGIELTETYGVVQDQRSLIDMQSEVIKMQGANREEADKVIKLQERVIDQLIQYLKNIDEWPPNIQPIDPNKITRSEAIFYETY